ncbi:hypothetical protein HJC23_011159 [Cyclotella cryptica]|uniref:Helicase-associated domain-containing protein n=1 Tax=Cyclotella cryptica TaxID=29204 RepID=A0ABD3NLU9_9STRA
MMFDEEVVDHAEKDADEVEQHDGATLQHVCENNSGGVGVTEDYWDHYQMADAAAASPTELENAAGGEEEGQLLYREEEEGGMGVGAEIVVPAIPPDERGARETEQRGNALNMHDLKWKKHIDELKAFKERHGHINVPRTDEFKKLYRFLDNQGQSYRKLIQGKKSSLTVQRIRDLDQLGLKWKVEPEHLILGLSQYQTSDGTSHSEVCGTPSANEVNRPIGRPKESESWDRRFEQLKQFHANSGHFRVPCAAAQRGTKRTRENEEIIQTSEPDEETIKLGKWVKRQRSQFASNALPSDRVEKLKEIGFDFKPGKASKEERTEIQLGLLDALRKRRELSNAQVADLNFLYDEWKRRAESNNNEPVFGRLPPLASLPNKFHLKWERQFEKLKEFKLQHGHTRVVCGDTDDKDLTSLAKWIHSQRHQYSKRKRGEKCALTEDRISRLESIGFEWKLRQELPTPSAKRVQPSVPVVSIPNVDLSKVFFPDESEQKAGVSNVYQYRWDCKFEEFKRYKAKIGIPRVTAKVRQMYPEYLPQLQELRKWIDNQRLFYQNSLTGKKNPLSDERIRLLVQAGFDFQTLNGKPVHFKGWNEKLNELKEFKERYGHTRVKCTDTTDSKLNKLSKWVNTQRGQYWKYVKGEKSCMNDERVAALEELGFEWRLNPGRVRKDSAPETVAKSQEVEQNQEGGTLDDSIRSCSA